MGKRSEEELIEKFIHTHGSYYDYSKVNYLNFKTKIKIICPKHGDFYQRIDAHLNGQGCKDCFLNKRTINKERILEKMNDIHNHEYHYDLSDYKNTKYKIPILCNEHGEFKMTPNQHLKGYGCPLCNEKYIYYENLSTYHVVEKLNSIHDRKYNYDLVEFKKVNDIIKIICPIHNTFERTLKSHLNGYGCVKCSEEERNFLKLDDVYKKDYRIISSDKKSTIYICEKHGELKSNTRYFINNGCKLCNTTKNNAIRYKKRLNKKFENRYTFNVDKYVNYRTPIQFYDRKNKISFLQSPAFRILNKVPNMNLEIFISKSKKKHNNKYTYKKSIYVNNKTNVIITCLTHGDFEQNPNNHLRGTICPKCSDSKPYSIKEKEVFNFIKQNNIYIKENYKLSNNQEIDIYLPDLNLGIEFNGLYWHSELYKDKNYHINKTKMCNDIGIQLIHIWEDQWREKQDIIKSMLLNKLKQTPVKIYARKTEIKEITDTKLVSKFLTENHLQGKVGSKIKIGLFHEDELVSLMTFGSLRKNLGQKSKEGSYEMMRFCNKKYTNVVGGASRLFKFFLKNYNPKQIISYASRDHSNGNLYKTLRFKLEHETSPNYFYIVDSKRKGRFGFRKDKLIKEGYSKDKTEHEIMLERGYYRIYDTGNFKFKY